MAELTKAPFMYKKEVVVEYEATACTHVDKVQKFAYSTAMCDVTGTADVPPI